MWPVWNRVVLLSCGMVIGWGVANLLSCAPMDIPRHRYRISLGVAVALILSAWIGYAEVLSGFAALFVVVGTALIAYAARARQLAGASALVPARAPEQREPITAPAAILIAHVLPGAYSGPEQWAAYLSHGTLGFKPRWLLHPLYLYRLRRSYEKRGSPPPSSTEMATLLGALRSAWPELTLDYTHPWNSWALEACIYDLAVRGAPLILLLPLDLDITELEYVGAALDRLREAVTSQVMVLPDAHPGLWGAAHATEELAALWSGAPWRAPAILPSELVNSLIGLVEEALGTGQPERGAPLDKEASPADAETTHIQT